jgi:hypothetical protein
MSGVHTAKVRSRSAARRGRGTRRVLPLALLLGSAACASTPPAGPPLPAGEGESIAAALEESTRIPEPSRIRFDWVIGEQGRRASGEGLARVEPPYRARLDLFLGDGTTVGRATLLDGQLQDPAGLPRGVIPPPDLLWAALGVFRPGRESVLAAARRREDGVVELRYRSANGQELRYLVDGQRILEAELLQNGDVVHEVTLAPGDSVPFPREATYRNLAEYRELKLTTRSIENVDRFPTDIWYPGP